MHKKKLQATKKKRDSQAVHWFLTINNPTRADGASFCVPTTDGNDEMAPHLKFLMIGSHIGEKRKVPHIHAVLWLKHKMRFTALKKLYPRARIEMRQGSIEQCAVYLDKEGTMKEWGARPKDASERLKDDWEAAYTAAKEDRFDDIPPHMRCRYYHNWKQIRQDNPVKPDCLKKKDNYWIVGPSQIGKSYYARHRWPDFFDKAINKWFTGYLGEETLLLDDLGPEHLKFLGWYLKRWADEYPFPAETKGGRMYIRPRHIVVTSQSTIEECCYDNDKLYDAVKNRFNVIKLTHWKGRIDKYLL